MDRRIDGMAAHIVDAIPDALTMRKRSLLDSR